MLNDEVWCTLAPSPIDGVGVFAIRDIPKGQKMYCEVKGDIMSYHPKELENLLPEIKEIVMQRYPIAETAGFFSPNDDVRLLSFMNHSKKPNYDKFNDVALRDIKKGEEIVEYYGYGEFK